MRIKKLQDFYNLMFNTREARRSIVELYLENGTYTPESLKVLDSALESLQNIPKDSGKYFLELDSGASIFLDLTYEIEELKKDIYFLTNSEDKFYSYLSGLHSDFAKQVEEGVSLLQGIKFNNFVTDRDGTINNYCARYSSSIQSVYNALFVSRFAKKCVNNSTILTSAPLEKIGLKDVSVSPENLFIYAASKGREYFDKDGIRGQFPVEKSKQEKLDHLNERLIALVKEPAYQIFSLIGSGLQLKFGQTTIAFQDIYKSIPAKDSAYFVSSVTDIVKELDPEKKFFRLENTGKDLEIILTVEDSSNNGKNVLKDFDKGDGLAFLDKALDLGIKDGQILVCGDTRSDLPMVKEALRINKNLKVIFVSSDKELQEETRNIFSGSFFVTEPDALVAILNNLSLK